MVFNFSRPYSFIDIFMSQSNGRQIDTRNVPVRYKTKGL